MTTFPNYDPRQPSTPQAGTHDAYEREVPLREAESIPADPNEGVGAFVCGLLSIFVLGIILGPVAISMASDKESGLAKAGKILGIIGFIFGILQILYACSGLAAGR